MTDPRLCVQDAVGESPVKDADSSRAARFAGNPPNFVELNRTKRRVNILLDSCEAIRFPFKKKLLLNNLDLSDADIPVKDLCHTVGRSLQKLSLAGNSINRVPALLVTHIPTLKHLDLSQCNLYALPEVWLLPNLRRLNLSHNRLIDFPEEVGNVCTVHVASVLFWIYSILTD